MCGIAGIVNFSGEAVPPGLLSRMAESLRHRGPDSTGVYYGGAGGTLGLAHARLSIIDLSGGQQPMSNDDGDVIWSPCT